MLRVSEVHLVFRCHNASLTDFGRWCFAYEHRLPGIEVTSFWQHFLVEAPSRRVGLAYFLLIFLASRFVVTEVFMN